MAQETDTDVLIIGAGAAGMMAATCAASFGLQAKVIDKRPVKLLAGHADGVTSRTMEIFDTFGLGNTIAEEGNILTGKLCVWTQGNGKLEGPTKGGFTPDEWVLPSYRQSRALGQARVQDIMEGFVRKKSEVEILRGAITEGMEVKEGEEFPVRLTVRRAVHTGYVEPGHQAVNDTRVDDTSEMLEASKKAGSSREVIKAKYVVACDGAHSWIRRELGIKMLGDDLEAIWGVIDIAPITDFPTPRASNMVATEGKGMLWIPREKGLVRIYVLLQDPYVDENKKMVRENITRDYIMENVRRILHPYKMDFEYCEWWAAYQIGQRVAEDNIDESGRIFMAGDAVHTHSPQAGQGMNVSIADTYNLMWKLNLVVKGFADPAILTTYRDERLREAQRLVNFDRMWAAYASGREAPDVPEGMLAPDISLKQMPSLIPMQIVGLHIVYPPSLITTTTPQDEQEAKKHLHAGRLPPGIVTGMRMPTQQVRRHQGSYIVGLHEEFKSDGRFRFVLFPGDISQPEKMKVLHEVATSIESLNLAPILDVLTIHTADPLKVSQIDLPKVCNPFDKRMGYDYSKVFVDEDIVDWWGIHVGSAYKKYGIDEEVGRLVLLRPDGYVAYQGGLKDSEPVRKYFEGFIVRRGENGS